MQFDPAKGRRIEAAAHALDLVPANAPASMIFEAIHPCVPAVAGLFSIIRPNAPEALVSQAIKLPPRTFAGWLQMPPEVLGATLAPLLTSEAGRLWRDSETIRGAQREQVDVLRLLDDDGLGEGGGLKVLDRRSPFYGVEHVMLALFMERGKRIPRSTQATLTALHEHVRAAVRRLSLPLLAHQPIHAQTVAEQSLGYICLSTTGSVREANRRARHLVERYRSAAGIVGARGALEDFAQRAQERARNGRPWQLRSDELFSELQVDVHRLAKETHTLAEDAILVEMREHVHDFSTLDVLTPKEREVVRVLLHVPGPRKQLALRLRMSEHTLRTHTQKIYSTLRVHSLGELRAEVKRQRG